MNNMDFMTGVFAELWRRGKKSLNTRDSRVHLAFVKAISKVGAESLRKVGVKFYVDPINETIPDLFRVVSVLQGFGLVSRPNPTYPNASIDLSEAACETLFESAKSEELSVLNAFTEHFALELDRHETDPRVATARAMEGCTP